MIQSQVHFTAKSSGFAILMELGWLAALLFFVAVAIVHICFALGVLRDAETMAERGALQLVPRLVWGLATLIGGVFVATAYWFIHQSNLFDYPRESKPAPGQGRRR